MTPFEIASAHRGGYMFRADLLDLGLDDRSIREAMRAKLIERLRHGTYALRSTTGPLSPEHRHLLIAYSVADRLGESVILSHHTAAIQHGAQTYGLDLSSIHVTQRSGRHGRQEAGVHHHVGVALADEDVVEAGGRLFARPERAVIESLSLSDVESGMVTASLVMRATGLSREQLEERMREHERWPGMLNVRLALRFAEPRCENPGEVRCLHMFRVGGTPQPHVQSEIFDARGVLIGRSDFEWLEDRELGELDGAIKYGPLNPHPEDPSRVVIKEKWREDRLRETGRGVTRWGWADLSRPHETCARINANRERSRRLYGKGRRFLGP